MPGYGAGIYGGGLYGSGGLDVQGVERAAYTLEVAWNAYNTGIFTFDVSTFGGTDTLGVSPFDVVFEGPYDDMSDLLAGASVNRGRSNTRDVVLAGSANFDIRDPDGLLNPANDASPLFGELEDRLHPVRFRGLYAASVYGLFYGWIRRSVWQPQGRKAIARLECVDLFWWLDRANPTIAATGATTTGAAIGLILDAVGWNDPASRDLDVGDTIPDFSADGKKTGLQLIQELLEAERGVFFINGSGQATYRDRLSRFVADTSGTIENELSMVGPGVDFEEVRTRITVTRTQNSYAAIVVDDPARRKVGYSDEGIETAYLSGNTQADDLASYLLSQLKQAKLPMYDTTLDNRTPETLTQVLARELNDRITIVTEKGNVSGDYHVDSMAHTITGVGHKVEWLLSLASDLSPFFFDVSEFDGADTFVF